MIIFYLVTALLHSKFPHWYDKSIQFWNLLIFFTERINRIICFHRSILNRENSGFSFHLTIFLQNRLLSTFIRCRQVVPSEDHARRRRLPCSNVASAGGIRCQPPVERNPAMRCNLSLGHHYDDMRLPVWRAKLRCGPRLLAQPSIRRCRPRIGTNKLRGDPRGSHLREFGVHHEIACERQDGAPAALRSFLVAGPGLHCYDYCRYRAWCACLEIIQVELLSYIPHRCILLRMKCFSCTK